MPSRTRQLFSSRPSIGQNQRFSHVATNLTAEDAHLNAEHVQVQRNKKSFTIDTTESESPRRTADTAQVTKISIDFHHQNDSKKRLEAAEKFNTFFASFGNLWKNEIVCLKKRISDALVAAKCSACTYENTTTLSTSSSRNDRTKKQVTQKESRHRQGPKRELTPMDVPYSLCSQSFSFFDSCS